MYNSIHKTAGLDCADRDVIYDIAFRILNLTWNAHSSQPESTNGMGLLEIVLGVSYRNQRVSAVLGSYLDSDIPSFYIFLNNYNPRLYWCV